MQLIVADTSLSFQFLCFYLLCSPLLCLSVFCFSFFFSFLGSERENGAWMGLCVGLKVGLRLKFLVEVGLWIGDLRDKFLLSYGLGFSIWNDWMRVSIRVAT